VAGGQAEGGGESDQTGGGGAAHTVRIGRWYLRALDIAGATNSTASDSADGALDAMRFGLGVARESRDRVREDRDTGQRFDLRRRRER
jgi:hypothetical protein